MSDLLQANLALVVVILLILVVLVWWLVAANRKTRVTLERREDDGTPARRNQALIDAPPASVAQPLPASQPAAVAAPAPAPGPAPTAPAAGADDLTLIKGLGPKLAAQLAGMGVTSFAQIAAWDEAAIDRVDAQLGRFQGRIRRDDWVAQAQLLAAGDMAGFHDRFGRS